MTVNHGMLPITSTVMQPPRRQSVVVKHSTVTLLAPESGPDAADAAAAAADALPQWAAAWRRRDGSGGQLTGRIFTTRGDRIAATRSW